MYPWTSQAEVPAKKKKKGRLKGLPSHEISGSAPYLFRLRSIMIIPRKPKPTRAKVFTFVFSDKEDHVGTAGMLKLS